MLAESALQGLRIDEMDTVRLVSCPRSPNDVADRDVARLRCVLRRVGARLKGLIFESPGDTVISPFSTQLIDTIDLMAPLLRQLKLMRVSLSSTALAKLGLLVAEASINMGAYCYILPTKRRRQHRRRSK
ncbi:unnamed protein product [Sphagnum balticum]